MVRGLNCVHAPRGWYTTPSTAAPGAAGGFPKVSWGALGGGGFVHGCSSEPHEISMLPLAVYATLEKR